MPRMALGHRGFGCIFNSKYKVSSTCLFNPSRQGEWEERNVVFLGGVIPFFFFSCSELDGFGCVDSKVKCEI